MTDEYILDQLRLGGDEGIRLAMDKYGGLVKKVVAGFVGCGADTEEVCNDVFHRVWRSRLDIDTRKSSLKSYICMIARSAAIDRARSLGRREALPIEDNDIGIDVDYEDEAAKRINQQVIAKCIREMKSPDREIFIDRYYFRKPIKEIAEDRGLKPKKVENVLSRGKKRLKDALIKGGIIL